MDYLADLHRLIRRDNVPFWNYQLPRTAGRLRVVPLFSDARRKRMGEDFERTEEDREEDGNGNRGGWERTLRGRKRNWRMGNGTLRREKKGFRED